MSNYDPAQSPWGGQPPQDPYGGQPQYPPGPGGGYPSGPPGPPGGYPPGPPGSPAGYPPGSPAGPPQYPPPPPGGYQQSPPTTAFPPAQDPFAGGDAGYPSPGGFPPPPADGFPPPAGGFPPSPPARRGGATKILIAIAAVVLIALCAGGGYTAYKLTSENNKDKPSVAAPSAQPSASVAPSASATRSTRPSGSAPAGAAANPDSLAKGDCFVNDGGGDSPRLRKVACDSSGAYEVVVKVPQTTDANRCNVAPPAGAGQGNWDASYKMDKNPGTSGDYVLCLKGRG